MTQDDNDTNTDSVKADDIDYDNDNENDNDIQTDTNDKRLSYAQWSTETHKNENAHVNAHDNIIRETEEVQNAEYYKA